MLQCTKCGQVKDESEFSKVKYTLKNNTIAYCYRHVCKECRRQHTKKYYLENKNHHLEVKKQYNLKNRDKILEYAKQYYLENRDKILEQHKQYYLENRDKILEYLKEYRLLNKNKIKDDIV